MGSRNLVTFFLPSRLLEKSEFPKWPRANFETFPVIIILVLRAMLWRVPCAVEVKSARASGGRVRRLPLYVHLWGCLLPPWPNYGIPRLRGSHRRRPRRRVAS